jgi:hypothetical protein
MYGKGTILVYLCILFLVGGCATVKLETEGVPVPDYVVRGSIPATGMRVNSAFIRYFEQEEGDELLGTLEYLNPYAEKQVVSSKYLKSLIVAVHVFNPRKETYLFIVYTGVPTAELGRAKQTEKELLYVGDLSRKEYNISLPIEADVERVVWYELWNSRGRVLFQGPYVRYEVR